MNTIVIKKKNKAKTPHCGHPGGSVVPSWFSVQPCTVLTAASGGGRLSNSRHSCLMRFHALIKCCSRFFILLHHV